MALLERLEQPPPHRRSTNWWPLLPMLAALAGYVLLRAPVMFNGYLYADDFALRWWAHTSSLTPEYVFRSYYGHVQPFGLITGWLMQSLFPGSFTALMVCTLIAQLATFALLWRIVLRLTGSNVAAFLAFLIPAMSMFGFETGVWWVEIAETVPYAFFMVVALWALVRALEAGGRWWFWSGLAFAGALISISKGAVGLIVLFMVVAAVPIGSPKPRGVRAALGLKPAYWLSLAGLAASWTAFLAVYTPLPKDPDWQLGRALNYWVNLYFTNLVNGAAGGPWKWFSAPGQTWNGVLSIPYKSPVLLAIGVILLIAVYVFVMLYRRNLLRYLVWMTLYAAAITGLAAYARGGSLIASSGYRYTFDFWLPLSLFAGLLFYPVIGEQEPFTARAQALGRRLAARGYPRSSVAVLAAGVFALSSLVSAVEPALRWVNSRTKQYVRTAQASMPSLPPDAQFLPQRTMVDLVHPLLMLPYASTEVVFAPDPVIRPFSEFSTNGLFGFASSGATQRQVVSGVTSESAGVCGYKVTERGIRIPMSSDLPPWPLVAQVSYAASADTVMEMAVGRQTYRVPVQAGLRNVFFAVHGPMSEVTARATDSSSVVCIDAVTVGARLGPDSPEAVAPPPTWPLEGEDALP